MPMDGLEYSPALVIQLSDWLTQPNTYSTITYSAVHRFCALNFSARTDT
jgi:hypothetical protein